MKRIAESELIINSRGAVYHLNLRPEELAETIITVGDPSRVAEVSKHFDRIEGKYEHREFITHTGYIGNKRLSVLSSGIFVASTHGLGIDNLMNFYRQDNNDEEIAIVQEFVNHTQLGSHISTPTIASAAPALQKYFVDGFYQGITVTCPGFYGPQGRVLRLGLQYPDFVDQLTSFRYGNHRISNFEMETSAIYGLGKLLNHYCLSLNAIVANRVKQEFSKDGALAVERLIVKSLEILCTVQ
ncbi:MAG: uridine phosphorylase [Chitinophagaceae bacterium]|nr:MAG: uridine phosphorylase [Chitinophagaceae bacterium]